ncbi:hypothetical protein [Nocardia aurea]|uniref:hypothetical protein n=1 Tax=Nocardia aurea TaxID=2144174 RepID=UPI000D694F6A|nr:hypothetical protein [Nocardia aurea]
MDRENQALSFTHLFDEEAISTVRGELGAAVAGRLRRDKPTLCDLVRVCHLLGRDPVELFG